MIPTIAIVGRPNVGKSTLFNVLTRSRDALVANQPGLTRDRKYGRAHIGERDYLLVDTGGLDEEKNSITEYIAKQALLAVQEADLVLFLVDGKQGLTAADEAIAQKLRTFSTPIYLTVNKTEGLEKNIVSAEFHSLGFSDIYPIAAVHKHGIYDLFDGIVAHFPEETLLEQEANDDNRIKIAVVGRPNVGKSTLVNRILGEERVIAFDQPGTTRDSIAIPFDKEGHQYTLIDTAGIRRRSKVVEKVEKFSVIKALQSIDFCHIAIMLLDAQEGITDQDAHLLGAIIDAGKGLVIAVNKWDGLEPSHREHIRYHLSRKLHFIDFVNIHFISALHGTGVGNLFRSVLMTWQAANQQIGTTKLNRILQQAVAQHPPPLIRGRRIKLRYIHQGGHNPPLFIIHGNQTASVPPDYERYLINTFRQAFNLKGTPIRLEFKQGENPFEGRKNTLTDRQVQKRKRLIKHVKKKH